MRGHRALEGQTHEVSGPITEWPAAALADLLSVECPDLSGTGSISSITPVKATWGLTATQCAVSSPLRRLPGYAGCGPAALSPEHVAFGRARR